MSFVLDNSVTMRCFFGDGKPAEISYAGKVLDAMHDDRVYVPVTWGLEVANVIAKAEAQALVTEARSAERDISGAALGSGYFFLRPAITSCA